MRSWCRAQIAQARSIPYGRKPATTIGRLNIEGVALATGAAFVAMNDNSGIADAIASARAIAATGRPAIVAVRIDYSKKTAFTLGAVKTNFGRFPLNEKLRFLARAAMRHLVG